MQARAAAELIIGATLTADPPAGLCSPILLSFIDEGMIDLPPTEIAQLEAGREYDHVLPLVDRRRGVHGEDIRVGLHGRRRRVRH